MSIGENLIWVGDVLEINVRFEIIFVFGGVGYLVFIVLVNFIIGD